MSKQQHTFLDPLWRRITLIALCALWTAFEFYNGDQMWSTITACLTVYGAYSYLYAYTPAKPKEPTDA